MCQNLGRAPPLIWTKPKRTAVFFFRRTSLKYISQYILQRLTVDLKPHLAFPTNSNHFRLWKEQRLGQYGRKEAPIKEALIPSTSEASIATSAGSVQIPPKSSHQGDQEVRPPPKNGITWGPVGSAGSPKSKKKGEKFRCCSVM